MERGFALSFWKEAEDFICADCGIHFDLDGAVIKDGDRVEGFLVSQYIVCPECGEPLYNIDFPSHCWDNCPVGGFEFFEDGF